jgi:hypothetical protein
MYFLVVHPLAPLKGFESVFNLNIRPTIQPSKFYDSIKTINFIGLENIKKFFIGELPAEQPTLHKFSCFLKVA